ncbi:MAG: hypothetical protein ACR2QK_08985 [Acidimicrobiales bacterium]
MSGETMVDGVPPDDGSIGGPGPGPQPPTEPSTTLDDRPDLVLDEFDEKLEAFNVLRKSDAEAADRILGQVGATDDVDRQIILELASKRPLGHPDRFPEAHTGAMRSLEVLDRNASGGVRISGLGPLAPIAQYLVQQVVHFLVKSHLRNVVNNLSNLYSRREAASLEGDPSRPLVARARVQVDRVAAGYRGNPLGFPTFILGGAFLSTIIGSLQGFVISAVDSVFGRVVLILALFAVMVAASWALLKGAAIARRRIKLTTDQPLEALYQTVGRCGRPPRDQARIFALLALILMAVAWITVPVALGLSFLTD